VRAILKKREIRSCGDNLGKWYEKLKPLFAFVWLCWCAAFLAGSYQCTILAGKNLASDDRRRWI